jgi:hypothetical protein
MTNMIYIAGVSDERFDKENQAVCKFDSTRVC